MNAKRGGFHSDARMCISERVLRSRGCIAVHHLRHLEKGKLVYGQHRWANVLCDDSKNCATAGHMVAWRGEAMMMKSYCRAVQCDRAVMMVNSPTYWGGEYVKSFSEQLVFSALAGRFETRIEEWALRVVMRMAG